MENLAFHGSLRLRVILLQILTSSLIHLSLKGCIPLINFLFPTKFFPADAEAVHLDLLTLSLLRVISFKFLLQPHQKYHIAQYGELDSSYSSSPTRKMIILPILTTSRIHYSLGRLGECTCSILLGSWVMNLSLLVFFSTAWKTTRTITTTTN